MRSQAADEMRSSAARSRAPSIDDKQRCRDRLLALASRFGITAISVVGSVTAGAATGTSDVDLVVDAEPDATYFALAAFALEAEALLGHPVDAAFRSGFRCGRDDDVLRDEVQL
ncbi:nucleotidyltransferase domain-containing protein [Rathayibacter festucae]|uniref:nucleotidyltransferase family protein n=1 Tax=Rathayibacter festucae TaxID=110937 RepID=UPI001FB353D6|nr:nucleotidyltransferase domain-containing protein [Rathayibacter festucae]MCJ1701213.1 nucleotidyltransferase domain-containing protein [Rathayibacter festucae]